MAVFSMAAYEVIFYLQRLFHVNSQEHRVLANNFKCKDYRTKYNNRQEISCDAMSLIILS